MGSGRKDPALWPQTGTVQHQAIAVVMEAKPPYWSMFFRLITQPLSVQSLHDAP